MAHKRKGQLTVSGEWVKHLRKSFRRKFWKGERKAGQKLIREERIYQIDKESKKFDAVEFMRARGTKMAKETKGLMFSDLKNYLPGISVPIWRIKADSWRIRPVGRCFQFRAVKEPDGAFAEYRHQYGELKLIYGEFGQSVRTAQFQGPSGRNYSAYRALSEASTSLTKGSPLNAPKGAFNL